MAWTVTIGEGATALTLDANIRFDIKAHKSVNDSGEVEKIDYAVEIEGVLRSDTPATVGTNMVTLSEQVTDTDDTVRIQIKQDGTTRWDFQVEDGFYGPYVTNFESREANEGGTGESHWRYALSIVYSGKGNQSGGGDVTNELHTSLAVTKQNGKVVRKVWKAEATSSTVDGAYSAVMSFKPSGQYITEETEKFFKDSRASAVWVWELQLGAGTTGVISWKCEVTAREGRVGFTPVPGPVLFKKMASPIRIDVRGVFEVMALEKAVAPAAHFTPSDSMVRATELEDTVLSPVIMDPKKGTYEMRYHEVWLCTDAVPPTPSHSGNHHMIGTGSAPSDGAMG